MTSLAYPGCCLLNDFSHVARKAQSGYFQKKMHNSLENEGFIRMCINDLRAAPTEEAWLALKAYVLSVWSHIGEADFAAYFNKIYLSRPWHLWFLGAMPVGCTSGQQSIEAGHRGDKCVLGVQALRADPGNFFENSVPTIMKRVSHTLGNHPPESMSQTGTAPVRAVLIYEAQLLISAASGQPYYRLEDDEGKRYYAVNATKEDTRKMNAKRANDYGDWHDNGTLPTSAKDKEAYKKVITYE